jgi:hypothetical protein
MQEICFLKESVVHYRSLFLMSFFSFISMYLLMYMMVDRYTNVYMNINQLYMALIMTIPMIFIELFFMSSMYPHKHLNYFIMAISMLTFIGGVIGIRKQIAVGDQEFLKSMIPHHAGALLMCKENNLQDPELIEFCKEVYQLQQLEIDFMKAKLLQLQGT